MKVLWLCSTATPEIAKEMKLNTAVNVSWIVNTIEALKKSQEVELGFCFPGKVESILKQNVEGVSCFEFPQKSYNPACYDANYEIAFEEILLEFKPDVIHIWGTEYPHTLAMIKTCEKLHMEEKAVVSIQGLCSVIEKHYFSGLPEKIVKRYTLRDLIKRENIKKEKEVFVKRGKFEIQALKKAKNVIGRTDWDKACVFQINPETEYHFCNETLRNGFYNDKWQYENCEKHSLFVSQGFYPVKGLHMVLKAMSILKKDYPDIHLYVGGIDIVNRGWKISSYGLYLKKLIKKLGLEDCVTYTGQMSEEEMIARYLKSNVFVSASAIENSSNSVGEAMLLGMPVVSSDVGGIKNLLTHEEEGYIYPFDEYYMLAYYIKQLFENSERAIGMGEKAREKAMETHHREKNLKELIKIYKEVQG